MKNKTKLGEGSTPGPFTAIGAKVCTLQNLHVAICTARPNRSTDAAEANARLLAKAPLLIEAKEVLTAIVGICEYNAKDATTPAVALARALLAKLEEEGE